MTAISGASMRCRTLADGTLRLEVDIEPRDALSAFQLFGKVGTPVALAALTGQPTAETEPSVNPEKGGAISRLAGQWCQMPEFWEWMKIAFPFLWRTASDELGTEDPAQISAEVIRIHCGVDSRAKLDHNEMAAKQFHGAIRRPFNDWLQAKNGG